MKAGRAVGALASVPCVTQASQVASDPSAMPCLCCWLKAARKEGLGWDFVFLKVHSPQQKGAFAYFLWEGDARCMTKCLLFLTQSASCLLDQPAKRETGPQHPVCEVVITARPVPCGRRSHTDKYIETGQELGKSSKQTPREELCGNSAQLGARSPSGGASLQWQKQCLKHP